MSKAFASKLKEAMTEGGFKNVRQMEEYFDGKIKAATFSDYLDGKTPTKEDVDLLAEGFYWDADEAARFCRGAKIIPEDDSLPPYNVSLIRDYSQTRDISLTQISKNSGLEPNAAWRIVRGCKYTFNEVKALMDHTWKRDMNRYIQLPNKFDPKVFEYALKARGLSVADVCKKTGYSRGTIDGLINGTTLPISSDDMTLSARTMQRKKLNAVNLMMEKTDRFWSLPVYSVKLQLLFDVANTTLNKFAQAKKVDKQELINVVYKGEEPSLLFRKRVNEFFGLTDGFFNSWDLPPKSALKSDDKKASSTKWYGKKSNKIVVPLSADVPENAPAQPKPVSAISEPAPVEDLPFDEVPLRIEDMENPSPVPSQVPSTSMPETSGSASGDELIKFVDGERNRLKAELSVVTAQRNSLQEQVDKLKKAVSENLERKNKQSDEVVELKGAVDAAHSENAALKEQIASLNAELIGLYRKLNSGGESSGPETQAEKKGFFKSFLG